MRYDHTLTFTDQNNLHERTFARLIAVVCHKLVVSYREQFKKKDTPLRQRSHDETSLKTNIYSKHAHTNCTVQCTDQKISAITMLRVQNLI